LWFDLIAGDNSVSECEFFPICQYTDDLKVMPTVSDIVKQIYCRWHFKDCARYVVAKNYGVENVPFDLFPPDTDSAELISLRLKESESGQ
jgi:hypothetical protein